MVGKKAAHVENVKLRALLGFLNDGDCADVHRPIRGEYLVLQKKFRALCDNVCALAIKQ